MYNKINKLCPFRPRSIVYHNRTDNLNLPDYGLNKICDHDIVNTNFQKCIGEKCMAFDKTKNSCKMVNKKQ